jgi:hypothetical protein
MAFAYRLEDEPGNPGRPADVPNCSAELAGQRIADALGNPDDDPLASY